jgi:hypothetical protein
MLKMHLRLIGLKETLSTLLCKWFLISLCLADSNFKIWICLKLNYYIFFQYKHWIFHRNWAMLKGHVFSLGFKVFNQIMKVCKHIVNKP